MTSSADHHLSLPQSSGFLTVVSFDVNISWTLRCYRSRTEKERLSETGKEGQGRNEGQVMLPLVYPPPLDRQIDSHFDCDENVMVDERVSFLHSADDCI